MINWPETNTVHLSGIRDYFGYVAVGDVSAMPRPNREIVALIEILLAGGKEWNNGIGAPESLEYDGPSNTGNQGTIYNHRLAGFVADTSFTTTQMLQAMNGRRYVVIFQDRNERFRVMGNSNDKGARFFCNMKIVSNQEGQTGYSFEFRLASRYPLPAFLFHPAENAQVYAAANGFSFVDLPGAFAVADRLLSLSA